MRIEPTLQDWRAAKSVYVAFAAKPGSQHIASEFALAQLHALLRQLKPKAVLEFGAGIGAITYALLTHPNRPARICSTEDNDFCLEQLAANLPRDRREGFELVSGIAELADSGEPWDVVIFDGGAYDPEEVRTLQLGSVCMVEGGREWTRNTIAERLGARNLKCELENHTPPDRYFVFAKVPDKKRGGTKWKFWLKRRQKGCWIGRVEAI